VPVYQQIMQRSIDIHSYFKNNFPVFILYYPNYEIS
jgi:hypothetical protein